MRKFYIILMTILLVLTMTVSAGATEYAEPMTEAPTEAAETPTEAVETVTEEVATEAPTEEDKEISDILNGATPEQIENIKQYIIYGINTLPFPDQVRVFCAENLNAIAWILAAAAFVVFFIGNRRSNKKLSAEATIMTNNAVDIAEKAEETVERSEKIIAMNGANMKAALDKNNERVEKAMADAVNCMEKVLVKAQEGVDDARKAIAELSAKETGLTEAEALMATLLNDLLQSSSLPQWKKDEFSIHLREGISKIEEVKKHDDGEEA